LRKILFPLLATALIGGCAAPVQQAAAPPPDDDQLQSRQADTFSTYLSARFAESEHDMPLAARYYGQSLKNDPGDEGLLSLAFFYATTSGDVEGAAKYATQVIAKTPDDRGARLALAIVAFKHHNYAEARKQLALSSKGPFTSLTVPLFDGWAAAAEGDAAAAAADMKGLQSQKGAEGVSTFHAALISDFLGKADQAATDYKAALTLNPLSPRVVEAYGNFLERQGDAAGAKAFYDKMSTTAALAPVVNAGLARIAAGKKPDPMIRNAEDGAAEALFGIAASLSDQASADISILYLRMALYLRPDLALAQVLLADRFETLQKFQDAETIYAGIDSASPYHRMAAVEAAVNRERLGHKDEAVRDLRTLAEADQSDSETWIALGDAYRDMDKNDEAIDAYGRAEKALKTPSKRDWPLFYARAMAEDKAHHWDKAEADIDLALKLSPDQPELLNYLGYSWVDQGRKIPEALAMLEKARALRPYDGYIVDSVGWAYYRLGRYDDAAQTLQAAVLLVPGDPTINDHLGDALWKAGHKIDARFQWNHALTFGAEDDEKAAIEQKLKTGLTG
jgi:tetratricopeptide (TPR) repeat protein